MALARVRNYNSLQCTNYLRKYWFCFLIAACVPFYFHYRPYNASSSSSSSFITCVDVRNSDQKDPLLIKFLRNNVIEPPSGRRYNLTRPLKEDFSQSGQGIFLREYFHYKRNGTFLEAGAWDGEHLSNTLILERQLQWTGLLLEPNPNRYPKLVEKHRKAHISNACISILPKPAELSISMGESVSHLVGYFDKYDHPTAVKVNCYPLYSLLAAMNMTTLDLLAIDLESVEVKVLKTIPWEDVDIRSILIEVNHIPERREYLKYYMAEKNYILEKEFSIDYFFVKNDSALLK